MSGLSKVEIESEGARIRKVLVDGKEFFTRDIRVDYKFRDVATVTLEVPVADWVAKGEFKVVFLARALVKGVEMIEATGKSRAEALRKLADKVDEWEWRFGEEQPEEDDDAVVSK